MIVTTSVIKVLTLYAYAIAKVLNNLVYFPGVRVPARSLYDPTMSTQPSYHLNWSLVKLLTLVVGPSSNI